MPSTSGERIRPSASESAFASSSLGRAGTTIGSSVHSSSSATSSRSRSRTLETAATRPAEERLEALARVVVESAKGRETFLRAFLAAVAAAPFDDTVRQALAESYAESREPSQDYWSSVKTRMR